MILSMKLYRFNTDTNTNHKCYANSNPNATPTLSLGSSPTPTPTTTNTPTPTPTPTTSPFVEQFAYLFIEPITGSTNIGEWMYNNGSNFFGFTNYSHPSPLQVYNKIIEIT